MTGPEPDEIFERTREEGRRRLRRPLVELVATAFVGGLDVGFGVAAYALAAGSVRGPASHLVGALAFGSALAFIVVGRSELFTENFLIPIAGLEPGDRRSWLKLAELWTFALVLNLVGGSLLAVIVTSHGVLRPGASQAIVALADHVAGFGFVAASLSGLVAGALMTLMTWFVEGAAGSLLVRVVMAWTVGTLIVLGAFNHAVVSTIELVYGLRYGGGNGVGGLLANLGISVVANLIGGLLLVTAARRVQAVGGDRRD